MSAESERVRQHIIYIFLCRRAHCIVQVALRIYILGAHGLMDESVQNALYAYDEFHAACRSEQMSDHGFCRVDGNILRRVAGGKISPKDAAAISSVLSTHIQAVKTAAELVPDDPAGGAYRTVSDEEMEAKVLARKQEIEAQKEGLSARREQMQALHAQAADHFSPDDGDRDGK